MERSSCPGAGRVPENITGEGRRFYASVRVKVKVVFPSSLVQVMFVPSASAAGTPSDSGAVGSESRRLRGFAGHPL